MLYPKNQESCLKDELFANPACEYRGAPFWAWNQKLVPEKLLRQIEMLKTMGMGGFHMHVRTGMDSPYLDREFMDRIRLCTEKAKQDGMLAWLYDEDRWPSGSAGGKVTSGGNTYVRQSLLFTVHPYTPDRPHRNLQPEPGRGQSCVRQDNGELLAVYDICLNGDGTLKSARRIAENASAEGTKWYAYQEYATDDPWFNGHPYVDTLNPQAIARFLEITHEAYWKAVGDEFGKTIPAIFTDEPKFTPKCTLDFALEQKDLFLPWTGRLPELYRASYDQDVLDILPELFWELPEGRLSQARYHFHDLVAELFVHSYTEQIGCWCRSHGIALTGHVMGEESLESQTQAVGDAMRSYPHFGLPGIDILCDFHEYTTAKQTQSIVRQTGAPGMLSELYGVTGWDYDFRGYKLQGDWQAALGVTVRVPHLTWMTMKGEAKRDYPASIGYQSPWWDQFSIIENHFARINTALTRGQAVSRVAVIHPVESYWLYWGPSEQTASKRSQMEQSFHQLAETLLFGSIDFDYICEAQLPSLCPEASYPLQVGKMAYDTVLVCQNRTLRSSTLSRLEAFQKAGGRVLFIGDCPDYVDALPSSAVRPLYEISDHIGSEPSAILDALEACRFLDIRRNDGSRENRLLYQLRKDGPVYWLFLANGKNPTCPDVDDAGRLRFILQGEYKLTQYDTMSGEIRPLSARYQDGKTILERQWHIHDSLLLKLETGCQDILPEEKPADHTPADIIFGPVEVRLAEPNMLLLDMAEYSFNGGPFRSEEELLRIDNQVRRELGIPLRRKEVIQPYLLSEDNAENHLTLRFVIPSEIDVPAPLLGLEDPEHTEISLNGCPVHSSVSGWYVDEDIQTLPLPPLHRGENILEITAPIGLRTNLEAFYLLGDFGVKVNGTQKTVTAPVRRLGFGDIVSQGLPFYTGNLSYCLRVQTEGGCSLRVPRYRGGLIKVFVDGKEAGNIIFSPYSLQIPDLSAGEHEVILLLYGTRYNGFAQLHHTPGVYFYQSPNSWRSAGDLWCYEYQFKPAGILKSPELYGGRFIRSDGTSRSASNSEHIPDRS